MHSPILLKSYFLVLIKIYDGCSISHVMTLVQALRVSQQKPVISRSHPIRAGIGFMHVSCVYRSKQAQRTYGGFEELSELEFFYQSLNSEHKPVSVSFKKYMKISLIEGKIGS